MEVGLLGGRSRIELTRVGVRAGICSGIRTCRRSGTGIGTGIIGRAGAGRARVVQDPLPAQPLVVVVGRPVHDGRVVHRVHDAGGRAEGGRGRGGGRKGGRRGRAPFNRQGGDEREGLWLHRRDVVGEGRSCSCRRDERESETVRSGQVRSGGLM